VTVIPPPRPDATRRVRIAALTGSFCVAALAAGLMADLSLASGFGGWDAARVALIFVTTLWLAWGAAQALLGIPAGRALPTPSLPKPTAPTVVLVPICAEDARAVAARVAAMRVSAAEAGVTVDFAILSDTASPDLLRREAMAFHPLVADRDTPGRVFYRHRTERYGRKAGNIEHFVRHSGGAYDFAVILDADSLMEGATIAHLVSRMQAAPDMGLLQTLPKVVGARSIFGRAMQFSSHFYAPIFARGLSRLQGRTGPFWGHNAIVRMRALADCCGLPALSGPPPFGGEILSHDYVEAALLARGGWRVEMDPAIPGSFEEGPDDLLAYSRRDRRWCQGNLQHMRLLRAPGLRSWSRFVFAQGILSYLVSLLWAGFLVASVAAAATTPPPDYFPAAHQLFPVFPDDTTRQMVALALGVGGLLLIPKLTILVQAVWTRRSAGFGGAARSTLSVVAETALSTVIAPLLLAWQLRAVLEVFAGRDGGWPATDRGAATVGFRAAWAATGWIVALGLAVLAGVFWLSPALTAWLLPVALPMVAAPLVVVATGRPAPRGIFTVAAEDVSLPPVVAAFRDRVGTAPQPVPQDPAPAPHPGRIA